MSVVNWFQPPVHRGQHPAYRFIAHQDLEQVVRESEIVLIGTRVDRAKLELLLRTAPHCHRPDQSAQQKRVHHQGSYEGVCW